MAYNAAPSLAFVSLSTQEEIYLDCQQKGIEVDESAFTFHTASSEEQKEAGCMYTWDNQFNVVDKEEKEEELIFSLPKVNLKYSLPEKAATEYAFKKHMCKEYSNQEELDKDSEKCFKIMSNLSRKLKQDLPCTKSPWDGALVLGYWTKVINGEVFWMRLSIFEKDPRCTNPGEHELKIMELHWDEYGIWWESHSSYLNEVPDQMVRSDQHPEENITLEFDCVAAFIGYIE